MNGVHIPPCESLEAHIEAAVHETEGIHMDLIAFVDEVRHDWHTEQQMNDELAFVERWQRSHYEWMTWTGVSQ